MEKTLIHNKRIILLRSFSFFVLVCSLLFFFASPVTVSAEYAEPLDYRDLDYKVQYGNEYNIVTVPLPADNFWFKCGNLATGGYQQYYGSSSFSFYGTVGNQYYIRVYPASSFGLNLESIPIGSKLRFALRITEYVSDENGNVFYDNPDVRFVGHYLSYDGTSYEWLNTKTYDQIKDIPLGGPYSFECTIEHVEGAMSFVPRIQFDKFTPLSNSTFKIEVYAATLEMEVSTSYWQQWQNEQNGEMLGVIGDKLDGVQDSLEGVQDSLDGVQDSIETLPGEIGDQFQNIMDSEKDNAKGEGNKFVDQVLDKLPDPSQGILSALGDLTSSINYTGTAATLAIPAIVLPSIDGLFPETEIWSGTEFSFSEYVEMMPSGLLTLVKSLFTIAIVLFCVYELKGIISYCLTLREKDGG